MMESEVHNYSYCILRTSKFSAFWASWFLSPKDTIIFQLTVFIFQLVNDPVFYKKWCKKWKLSVWISTEKAELENLKVEKVLQTLAPNGQNIRSISDQSMGDFHFRIWQFFYFSTSNVIKTSYWNNISNDYDLKVLVVDWFIEIEKWKLSFFINFILDIKNIWKMKNLKAKL